MNMRILALMVITMLALASCQQGGVPVPADFPVKLTLPAGSEIGSNPAGDAAEQAIAAMNMKVVTFTSDAGEAKVKEHIAKQLKSEGFSKMMIPGMGGSPQDAYSKEGSNMMISITAAGGNMYTLMSMEMPDLSKFRP